MQHQSSSSNETTVEATVFDLAPRVGLPLLLVPLLMVPGIVAPSALLTKLLVGLSVFTLLAYDLRPQRRPRTASIVCKPGVVAIPGGTKIRARDLLGATTARHNGTVSLMLNHKRRRDRPIILDLPDEAALATVCRALGIGHHGFGYVDVALRPPPFSFLRTLAAALTAPAMLMFALMPPGSEWINTALPWMTLGLLAWLVAACLSWNQARANLRLTGGGMFLMQHPWTPRFLRFDQIQTVARAPGALVLDVMETNGVLREPIPVQTSRLTRLAPTTAEVDRLGSQLHAAVDRAHGKGASEPAPEAFAAMLERAPGESLRDWLARVDAMAIGTPGYRSSAAASAEELWQVLEDPNATPNVRAAAARLLARIDPKKLRVRVGDVLSTVHDEAARVRIAASIDDEALVEAERREIAMNAKRE